jgi:hypothetical protein
LQFVDAVGLGKSLYVAVYVVHVVDVIVIDVIVENVVMVECMLHIETHGIRQYKGWRSHGLICGVCCAGGAGAGAGAGARAGAAGAHKPHGLKLIGPSRSGVFDTHELWGMSAQRDGDGKGMVKDREM